jgi:hypothetical protein
VSEVGRNFLNLYMDIYLQILSRLHRFTVPVLCIQNTLKATRAAMVAHHPDSKLAGTGLGTKEHIACANCQIILIKKFRQKL